MNRQKRIQTVIDYFAAHQPAPDTELVYGNDFELLVAIVLSAQCTDRRINQVTPALFAQFPTPELLAKTTPQEVYPFIRTVSYPNNKAKYLVELSKCITHFHRGRVPSDVTQLQQLPGVGRKTAHVFVATRHGTPAVGVDTHVFRVARRLGLVSPQAKTPLAVEKELVRSISTAHLPKVNHWLVLHGRYICQARKPRCSQCPLATICAYRQTEMQKKPIPTLSYAEKD